MKGLFGSKASKTEASDEEKSESLTLEELIQWAKEYKTAQDAVDRSERYNEQYDGVALERSYREGRIKDQTKWSDLAYQGDWTGLLRMAHDHNISLINSRRLQKTGSMSGRPPAGYTALHQAAYHNAPVAVIEALINLGALRCERTTDGKNERPIDVARSRGHTDPALLALLKPPNRLENWSEDDLNAVQSHFHEVIRKESHGLADDEKMRLPNLEIFRELGVTQSFHMSVPGMYGGFTFRLEGDHLISESYCRVAGGSGMTYHITPNGSELVASGWG